MLVENISCVLAIGRPIGILPSQLRSLDHIGDEIKWQR